MITRKITYKVKNPVSKSIVEIDSLAKIKTYTEDIIGTYLIDKLDIPFKKRINALEFIIDNRSEIIDMLNIYNDYQYLLKEEEE